MEQTNDACQLLTDSIVRDCSNRFAIEETTGVFSRPMLEYSADKAPALMSIPNAIVSLQALKQRLRASFLAELPQRLQSAREQAYALRVGNGQADAIAALHLLFHTIKGSGASFDCDEVAAIATQASDLLRQMQSDGHRVSRARLARLIHLVEQLLQTAHHKAVTNDSAARTGCQRTGAAGRKPRHLIARTCASFIARSRLPANASYPPASQFPKQPTNPLIEQPLEAQPDLELERYHKPIYLCDDDIRVAAELCDQLAYFGYQVTPFTSLDALCNGVSNITPAALILDVVFPEGRHAGPETLVAIAARADVSIPTIFISAYDNFAARLEAVKAGGSAYCTKPVRITELVELLDRLTQEEVSAPLHILVIDDDPQIARWHAQVLEEAGMVVRFATRPQEVLDLLSEFNADLVLMDMYMPACSGPELARVLRQMPGYVSLPIIYVSSETDMNLQFEAMQVGADGFLAKPIDRDRLVTEVSLRAERMRALHALMVRDGLTGLFNHNTILQFLDIGLADARRAQRDLCFAMIDVDHFKRINDTYGHPVGDQVLLALSRALKLRLRASDLVGRYGGEEFAILLSGVDVVQAWGILEDLRKNFAAVMFYAGDKQFTCTFSGGIAGFPLFSSAENLIKAADIALYLAKHAGRNRIEIANPADRVRHEREAP